MNLSESLGGKSHERPPSAKPPVTEEAAIARAKEMIKKMGLPINSPTFEEAFIADFIKRLEASGQEVVRTEQ